MELLDRVEKEIRTRLEELRPLLDEARELEDALQKLSSQRRRSPRATAPTPARTRQAASTGTRRRRGGARRTTTGGRRGRRTRVSGEKRREQLVSLARENPDIKAREIANRLGTTPNNIYNLIRRLEAEGTIERRNGRLLVKKG